MLARSAMGRRIILRLFMEVMASWKIYCDPRYSLQIEKKDGEHILYED